jgi:hypothetical protein
MESIDVVEIAKKRRYLKRLFISIYVLNLFDALFTYILVKNNVGREANLIMKPFVTKAMPLAFIKAGIVLLVLLLLYKRMETAKIKHYKVANLLFGITLGFYSLVVLVQIVMFGLWMII